MWVYCPPDRFILQVSKIQRLREKQKRRGKESFEPPPGWLVVLTATVGPGLMSSRRHFNEASTLPQKSPLHSPLNPLLEATNSLSPNASASLPAGTGPQDPQLGSSVCVCVCMCVYVCVFVGSWMITFIPKEPANSSQTTTGHRKTDQLSFFSLCCLVSFFSNQRAVGCIISLTSAVWGGVNLLITTQGHI